MAARVLQRSVLVGALIVGGAVGSEDQEVYYTALNDVAVVDFRESQLNFFDFTQGFMSG